MPLLCVTGMCGRYCVHAHHLRSTSPRGRRQEMRNDAMNERQRQRRGHVSCTGSESCAVEREGPVTASGPRSDERPAPRGSAERRAGGRAGLGSRRRCPPRGSSGSETRATGWRKVSKSAAGRSFVYSLLRLLIHAVESVSRVRGVGSCVRQGQFGAGPGAPPPSALGQSPTPVAPRCRA